MILPIRMCGAALAALIALAGCGRLLGIEDLRGPDTVDAPPDVPIGDTVKITGIVRGVLNGQQMPIASVRVELYRLPQDTPVATAISAQDGSYALDVPTNNMPIDGYLQASDPQGQLDTTFHYLPRPVTAAATLDLEMFSGSLLSQIATLYGTNHDPAAAAVFVTVIDPDDKPVAGVSVQAMQPTFVFHYNDPDRSPSPTAISTGPDGIALLFGVPSGTTITATGSLGGRTFPPASTRPTELASCHILTLRATATP